MYRLIVVFMAALMFVSLPVLAESADPAGAEKPGDATEKTADDGARAKQEEKKAEDPLKISIGGFARLNGSYDTGAANVGNFCRWVVDGDGGQANATASFSRFNFKVTTPETERINTKAFLEMDFLGGGAENKPHLRLRHGYVEISCQKNDWSILAGQTWDLTSMNLPSTVNFIVGWWAGNIGFRRPQLRLTKGLAFGDMKVKLQGALARTIGDGAYMAAGDAGAFTGQGRVSLEMPLGEKKALFALSGHWGQEEYNDTDFLTTWALCLEWTVPLGPVTFKGEAWTGANLDEYCGGVGQGVTDVPGPGLNLDVEVRSKGWWISVSGKPKPFVTLNGGGGVDDPMDDDLNNGGRTQNLFGFFNAMFKIDRAVIIGVEISYWKTHYKGADPEESTRFEAMFMYKF